ncbi:hypothetical protein L6164_013250 [Bauhinia variegata]|uniref:Uncharacterized protein n=1 Tax=Bauhinia variegata TaxID=167791 RepID=A0ACB9PC10_BAUVA|nr:hypothetical protein L6164_013250 [Bauhinia variegata]
MVTSKGKLEKLASLVILVYLWVWTSWNYIPTVASNHLKPGDFLNSSSQLLSKNGRYRIDFSDTSFDEVDTGFTYLQICDREYGGYAIWIAKPNQPFSSNNSSAVLTLDDSGELKITCQGGEPIILYSPPQAINNTVATLLDNGNLVLQEPHPNGSTKKLLWQSFDYPSDTLIPGMKLGVSHKTGHTWSLTSWLTNTYPSSGSSSFKLEWDPKVSELIIRRGEKVYWKSGVLKRNKRFENIAEEAQNGYEYIIVSNEDEHYFSYHTQNGEKDSVAIWNLMFNGDLKDANQNFIAKASNCYGYNTDGGCQIWNLPSCRHKDDVFVPFTGFFNTSSFGLVDSNNSLGISDCRETCWNKCGNDDCVGYRSRFVKNETACLINYRSSSGPFIESADGFPYFILKNSQVDHKGTKTWLWVSAATVGALIISCAGIISLVRKRRKAQKKTTSNAVLDLVSFYGSVDAIELSKEKNGHDINVFSYASVMAATNNFSSENKLGEGGFGPVYKGKIKMGKEVAIKRLSKSSKQGSNEFRNELRLISELQHMNLVQLLGCCVQGEENILIYEYMPNKSLDFILFDPSQSKLLDWRKRFKIIEGITQGLLYLHKYSRLKIVHRDLKASNILLDENMNPKISDFGLARIFTQEAGGNTTRIVGTHGYMSPEYIMKGAFSAKSDVYSFGILLFEIIGGRRNNNLYDPNCPLNLVGYAWDLWKEGAGLEMVDPSVNDSFIPDQVLRCIHVALLCTQERPVDRPSMSDVLSMLTNENAVLPLPHRPAFYFRRMSNIVAKESLAKSEINSRNDLSVTDLQAR